MQLTQKAWFQLASLTHCSLSFPLPHPSSFLTSPLFRLYSKCVFKEYFLENRSLSWCSDISGFHLPAQRAYSLQSGHSLTDCSISLTFNVGLTITVMKNFPQQEHFQDTDGHFLAGGGGKNPVPFGEGFRFLPPLPSSQNSWRSVGGNFRKSVLCLKIAKNTFGKKCLFALLLTLGIIMGTKKRAMANQNHRFQIKEVSAGSLAFERYHGALETCYVIS